ncbi:phospholipase A and acyltransferase 3-like [Hyperolius riggenbachi]|uniref:phospholipase A and acyltransferase 3-like n=1 Tax=Hyperolius riggenbachi TaxID=752182 RepID=UPI0035A27405
MSLEGPYPDPGDLIEIFGIVCQHWGVYVGNGDIVHITDGESSSSNSSFISGGRCVVRRQDMYDAAKGFPFRVNNKYDDRRDPYPADKIVRDALSEVGSRKKYKLTTANCEHFVTKLRYGRKASQQVKDGVASVVGGLVLGATAATAIGAAPAVAVGGLFAGGFYLLTNVVRTLDPKAP